ncbi:MAG: DegV family protein [Anaerolineales bacterium]|nr:DegV family protein [Anaerolineales bacterium]
MLIWGEENYRDGIDIQPEEFYTKLSQSTSTPTTSQVTIGSFKNLFDELIPKDYQILNILISSKLSGTIESANQAKEMFPKAAIEIIDSYSTAMALGFQVLTVAKAVVDGATLEECLALAEKARNHTGVIFAVDTLEFLHRGGRIGGGTRFLGTALNIKPILELRDGRVEPLERVRTRRKSLARVVELIAERIGDRNPIRLAALHANSPEDAQWLMNEASKNLTIQETVYSEVSPVVGTHAGPGTVGLAYMAGL